MFATSMLAGTGQVGDSILSFCSDTVLSATAPTDAGSMAGAMGCVRLMCIAQAAGGSADGNAEQCQAQQRLNQAVVPLL